MPTSRAPTKGAEHDPALVDVARQRLPLPVDGLVATPVRLPGRRAPLPRPLHQLGPAFGIARRGVGAAFTERD